MSGGGEGNSPLHPFPWLCAELCRQAGRLASKSSLGFRLWILQQLPWEGVKSFLCYRSDVSVMLSRFCSSTIWVAFALGWEQDSVSNQV